MDGVKTLCKDGINKVGKDHACSGTLLEAARYANRSSINEDLCSKINLKSVMKSFCLAESLDGVL